MNQTDYDVIIVGAGPAGIFAALTLTESARPRLLMLDKGPSLEKRRCPAREMGRCVECATCSLMTGWGGSGAFSIIGSERVWIRDKEGNVRNLPIAALEGERDFQALSFNRQNQVVFADVQALVKHPFEGRLYRLYTTRGIALGVSGEHSVFTWEDGEIRSVKTQDLQVGDYILAPNRVPETPIRQSFDVARFYVESGDRIGIPNSYTRFKRAAQQRWGVNIWQPLSQQTGVCVETLRGYRKHGKVPLSVYLQVADLKQDDRLMLYGASKGSLPPRLTISPDFCELLGFYIAEGSQARWKTIISQSVKIDYLENLLSRNQIGYSKRLITNNMGIPGRVLWKYNIPGLPGKFISDLTIDRDTGKKRIPPFIFSLPPEHRAAFLQGFFQGDGSVLGGGKTTPPQRRFHNTSLDVVNGICYLLMSLGETYSVYQRRFENPNWSDGYEVRQRARRYGKKETEIGELALTKILRIETYDFKGFLYDLVVPDTQAFAGGVGMIFFHNSDGKLTLTTQVGGLLADIRGQEEAERLVREVDALWVRYGADGEPHSGDLDRIEAVARQAALAGLRLQHYPIRHLGTERSGDILGAMHRDLVERGVEVRVRTEVARVLTDNGTVRGVETVKGQVFTAPYVIVAPGREGAGWLTHLARDLRLNLSINPVDIGVRVELPAQVLAPLTDLLYEPKFLYFSRAFDDRVRTFCTCPYGEVVTEWAGDVLTVNGHSYADKRTENTNFAVLVSKNFTEPFKEPIAYGKYIARLANLLSGGIMVQRLGDLRAGRRTTDQRLARCITRPTLKEATPGDLNLVLPYRYVVNILEMLDALDQVAPGVASRHTLLYGVEAKFYSSRLKLSRDLETEVRNLFAAGDGAGVTRGLVQASASGVVAARAILERL